MTKKQEHDHTQKDGPGASKEHVADHGHSHTRGHSHLGHHHHHSASDNIKVALLLNLVFSIIEFAGGLWTGSVAILSDAVHDFGDCLALGLAYVLEKVANKKSDQTFSYGYRRMSLLSALITCTFLITASIAVLIEAIPRLFAPVQPRLDGMLALAILGIAVNGFAAWRMKQGSTMNEKVVSWHLMEDVLGWVAVLIGTIIMMFVDVPILDPILSVGFTLFILWRVVFVLKGTMRLFLQGTPESIDLVAMRKAIESIPGVVSTHDTHLWSIDGESHVLTLHVVVSSEATMHTIESFKTQIRQIIQAEGKIHVTMEIEGEGECCPDIDCVNPV